MNYNIEKITSEDCDKNQIMLTKHELNSKILEITYGPDALFKILPIEAAELCINNIIAIDWTKQMINNLKKESKDINDKKFAKIEDVRTLLTTNNESIDFIYSMFEIFLFEEIDLFLNSVFKVLKPGGKLITSIWHDGENLTRLPTMTFILNIMNNFLTNFEPVNEEIFKNKLKKAGFKDIKTFSYNHKLCFPDKESVINFYMNRNSVMVSIISSMEKNKIDMCKNKILEHVYLYNPDEECIIDGSMVIFIATKPIN